LRTSRLCHDRGYALAEADIAAWLRASVAASPRARAYEAEIIAAGVERGDHRPGDRSERCAGCGAATADGRGRYVLRTTGGYCDSCMEAGRREAEGATTDGGDAIGAPPTLEPGRRPAAEGPRRQVVKF